MTIEQEADIIRPEERVFDRLPFLDERSKEFPMSSLFTESKKRSYTWRCLDHLDQLREGACAGFACAHELIARPSEVQGIEASDARRIYKLAQKKFDPWPGENYEGTALLAAIKATMELHPGMFDSYRWNFGLDDLQNSISWFGPAVVGTNWYDKMSYPDSNGYVSVSGKVVGGHAWLIKGINMKHGYFLAHNSWGNKWGMNGDFKIRFNDMKQLLKQGGESAVFVNRKMLARRKKLNLSVN